MLGDNGREGGEKMIGGEGEGVEVLYIRAGICPPEAFSFPEDNSSDLIESREFPISQAVRQFDNSILTLADYPDFKETACHRRFRGAGDVGAS